ncbi:hypothetical protein HMI56_001481 [Coelomomyces lativittatus]|nr:hypothetical protein HMI56_001481 [Coelomomyces lativittatus]
MLQASLSSQELKDHVHHLWHQLDTYFHALSSSSTGGPRVEPYLSFLAYITWPTDSSPPPSTPSRTSTHFRDPSSFPSLDHPSKRVNVPSSSHPPEPSPSSSIFPRMSSASSSQHSDSKSFSQSTPCKLVSMHEHLPISIHLMDATLWKDELIVAFTGPEDKHVYFWNLTQSSWVHKWLPQSSKSIFFLTFSPSSRYLVTTDLEYDVTVYDWIQGKEERKRKWHTRVIHRVYVPKDEDTEVWISCSSDHSMKLWTETTLGSTTKATATVGGGCVGRIHGTAPFVDVCVHQDHVVALQPYQLRWYHRTTYTCLAQLSLTHLHVQKSPARRLWTFVDDANNNNNNNKGGGVDASSSVVWVSTMENIWSSATHAFLEHVQVHAGVLDVSSSTMVWSQRDGWVVAPLSFPSKKKKNRMLTHAPCKHLKLLSSALQKGVWIIAAFEKELAVYYVNE